MKKYLLPGLVLVCISILVPRLASCQKANYGNAKESSHVSSINEDWRSLTIVGYNYTNHPISDFRVAGNGGGNIRVSGFIGGGGGDVCCVRYLPQLKKWRPLIKWQQGGCKYSKTADWEIMEFPRTHYFYREERVLIDPLIPQSPEYIEVHFYPDGHVEIALTEMASSPRLKLDPKRAVEQQFKRCPDDKRPQE